MQHIGIIFVVIAVLIILFIIFAIALVFSKFLRKVGPNEALIIYGTGGIKIITGGSRLVLPLYQRAQVFSLELLSFNIVAQSLYTIEGVVVNVEAHTQVKVRGDEESIRTAAEHFFSKSQQERDDLIGQVMKGHLRGIVGQLTIESLAKDFERVNYKMLQTVTPDMRKMGLEVISFNLREAHDDNGYIANMRRSQIVEMRRQAADMAYAEAAFAKALAHQDHVTVEADVLASQAEYQRGLALRKADLFLSVVVHAFLEEDEITFVGEEYSVQVGISRHKSPALQEEQTVFPADRMTEPVLFDASLHTSQNIELIAEWHKSLSYNLHNSEPQFVEFTFRVTAPGPSFLVVDFYQERRWFRTARVEFNAVDKLMFSTITNEE